MKFSLKLAAVVTALAIASVVSTFSQGISSIAAAGDCTVTDTTFDAEEAKFAELINAYRRQNGLGELTVSVNLNRMATWHAIDMATKGYFSHEDSLGRRAEARGADCGAAPQIGENIAAGPTRDTAQEAFDAWKASEGHNRNMLNSGYKQIGIARHYDAASQWGWYWVTDFSLNTDGTDLLHIGIQLPGLLPTSTPTPTKTATPVPTATPVTRTATMISPAPGSTLSSSTQKFAWKAVSGATNYQIYIGTKPGGYDIRNVRTTATSVELSGLPGNGVKLYVRLWTQVSGAWSFVDYTYTAAK